MKKHFILQLILLFAIFSPMVALSQITWQIPEITSNVQQICKDETVTVKFTLDQAIANGVLTVNLPVGYEYAGNETMAGGSLTSTDSSDKQNPKFTFDVAGGTLVTLSFTENATCDAESTGTQTFKATLEDSTGVQIGTDSPTKTVTIENPILNVLNATNSASGIGVGETITRTVRISNGGLGDAEYINIYDEFDEGTFTISNPSPAGTITTSTSGGKTTVKIAYDLTANPISQNGTRNFVYNLTLSGCSSTTPFQSKVYSSYGCSLGDECHTSNSKNTSVNLTSVDQPDLAFSFPAKYNENGCWDSAITKTATITNNGTGLATDVKLDFGPSTSSNTFGGYIRQTIDPASISITSSTGNPATIAIDNVTRTNDSSMTCAPSNNGTRVTKVETTLPNIAPGETITITWQEYVCPLTPQCTTSRLLMSGFVYDYSYKDECAKNERKSSRPINAYALKQLHVVLGKTIEGPIDFNDGDTGTIKFPVDYVSSTLLSYMPTGTQIYLQVELPDGFNFCGNEARLLDRYGSPRTGIHAPSAIETNGNIKKVYFDQTDGSLGLWSTTQLEVNVCASCGTAGTEDIKISWGVKYPDGITCNTFPNTYDCEQKSVVLHCPDCSGVSDYLSTRSVSIERTSLGTIDANNDWIEDSPTTIDPADAQVKRMMNKDEVEYEVSGIAKVTNGIATAFLDLTHSNAVSTVLTNWNYIGGTVEVTPIGGTATSYPLTAPTRSGYTDTFDLSMIPQINDGDSFVVKPKYQLDSPHPSASTYRYGNILSQQIVSEARLYGKDAAGNELICGNTYSDYMNIIELYTTLGNYPSAINGCSQSGFSRFIAYSSSGACCSNYNGGMFPGEYRELMDLKQIQLILPDDLEWDEGYLQTHIPNIGRVNNLTPVESTNADGDTVLTFDISQMTINDGGTHQGKSIKFDLGTYVSLYYKLRPKCGIYGAFSRSVKANYLFEHINGDQFSRSLTRTQTGNAGDAELKLTSTQTYDAYSNTANWTLDVNSLNRTSGIDHVYVYFDEANSDISVTSLKVDGVAATKDANGFFRLGNLTNKTGTDDEFNLEVDATFTNCTPRQLPVVMGFSCDEYPTDLASACTKETVNLRINPQPSQVQTTINIPTTVNQCQAFNIEYRIVSAKVAEIKDLNVLFDFAGPNGLKGFDYVANSATIEYPAGSSPVSVDSAAETKLQGTTATIAVNAQDLKANPFSTNSQTLTGQGGAPNNEMVIRMQLIPNCNAPNGTRLGMTTYANRPCGDVAEGNGIKVFSDQMKINGLPDPYESALDFSIPSEMDGCANKANIGGEYTVTNGATSANDREFKVLIPANTTYEGNLTCTSADCVTMTGQTTLANGTKELTFSVPVGYETTAVRESIKFTFDVGLTADNTCGNSNSIELSSYRIIKGAACGAGTCPDTTMNTGNATGAMATDKPDLTGELKNYIANETTGEFTFDLEITNNGSVDSDTGLIVEFYCKNTSGATTYLSGNDITIPSAIAKNGGTYSKSDLSITASSCDVNQNSKIVGKVKPSTESSQVQCICSEMEAQNVSAIIIVDIELADFSVAEQDCKAALSWATASEELGDKFLVQRSLNGVDFETIQSINANGYPSQYSLLDEHSVQNTFYRLVMINGNGESATSKIVLFDESCKTENVRISPNPIQANESISIIANQFDKNIAVEIYNINGEIVQQENNLATSNGIAKLRINDLPNGIYMIRIVNQNQSSELKLIVQ